MPKSREMPIMLIDTQGLHTPLSFLLLSIFLGSLYLVLFIAFLMLCLCKPKREQFIVPGLLFQGPNLLNSRASSLSSALTEAAKSSTSALMVEDPSLYASPTRENSRAIHSPCRLPATDSIPTTRKILIFLYVCFRAFTIFLFTFSVGLSVLLSIESESFKTLVSCVQNAKSDRIRELVSQEAIRRTFSAQNSRRIASPWLKELRQIEKASDIELSSQVSLTEAVLRSWNYSWWFSFINLQQSKVWTGDLILAIRLFFNEDNFFPVNNGFTYIGAFYFFICFDLIFEENAVIQLPCIVLEIQKSTWVCSTNRTKVARSHTW